MNASDIYTIIAIFVGLIALPFTYFIGRRNRTLPDIRYAIDSDIILNPDDRLLDQNLEMTIGGHQITSISRTRLAFWNQRGDAVRGTDIVKSDPIRLEFAEGDTPLQARTLSSSREQINLTASINSANPASVNITFEFLNSRDGAIIEIVHQGTEQPRLTGTLIGAKIRRHKPSNLDPSTLAAFVKRSRFRRIPKGAATLAGATLGATLSAIAFVWLAVFYHPPVGSLVNTSRFNLNSLLGQANFANAVFASSNHYANSDAILFLLITAGALWVLFIGAAISSFRTFSKERIPYDIANGKHIHRDVLAGRIPCAPLNVVRLSGRVSVLVQKIRCGLNVSVRLEKSRQEVRAHLGGFFQRSNPFVIASGLA